MRLGVEKFMAENSGVEKSGVGKFMVKSPGLKGLGLKLGVVKSGVEMSFNQNLVWFWTIGQFRVYNYFDQHLV